MNAKIIEVIKTETSEGKGTPDDPMRNVTRYWEKNGKLIHKEDPILNEEGKRQIHKPIQHQ